MLNLRCYVIVVGDFTARHSAADKAESESQPNDIAMSTSESSRKPFVSVRDPRSRKR